MTADAFLQELQRLIAAVPKPPTHLYNSVDSDFGDHIYHSKNLYYSFDCAHSENSCYLYDSYLAVKCLDSDYSAQCELWL